MVLLIHEHISMNFRWKKKVVFLRVQRRKEHISNKYNSYRVHLNIFFFFLLTKVLFLVDGSRAHNCECVEKKRVRQKVDKIKCCCAQSKLNAYTHTNAYVLALVFNNVETKALKVFARKTMNTRRPIGQYLFKLICSKYTTP